MKRYSKSDVESNFDDNDLQAAYLAKRSRDSDRYFGTKKLEYKVYPDKFDFDPELDIYFEKPLYCENEVDIVLSPMRAIYPFIDMVVDTRNGKVLTTEVMAENSSSDITHTPSPLPTPCLNGTPPTRNNVFK
jgi:hypothetical protein